MNEIFNKIKFLLKKPKVVVINEGDPKIIKKFISQILGSHFKVEKEVLIAGSGEKVNLSNLRYLVLNFDNEKIREVKEKTQAKIFTFGLKEGADLRATDIKINGGANFKVDYKGNIVPIWLDKPFGNEQIYAVLSAVAVGIIFDLNLVEISQALMGLTSAP